MVRNVPDDIQLAKRSKTRERRLPVLSPAARAGSVSHQSSHVQTGRQNAGPARDHVAPEALTYWRAQQLLAGSRAARSARVPLSGSTLEFLLLWTHGQHVWANLDDYADI
jgi:hypothetical protein